MAVQFSSLTQSCPTLCDPMDCSTPGFPVHHQLLELTQTHVHHVGDAIQPSHPLSSPSPPTFNLSQHQDLSFPLFRLVSGNLGRWVWACTLRVYKVFTKTDQGPWLRGDCLGPASVMLSTICIVLLSEFVSQNAWLQHQRSNCQHLLDHRKSKSSRKTST